MISEHPIPGTPTPGTPTPGTPTPGTPTPGTPTPGTPTPGTPTPGTPTPGTPAPGTPTTPGPKTPAAPVDGRIAVLAWTLWEPQGGLREHDLGELRELQVLWAGSSCGGIASVWIQVTREKGRELREPRQSSRGLDLWLGRARSKSKADSECSTGPRQLVQQL